MRLQNTALVVLQYEYNAPQAIIKRVLRYIVIHCVQNKKEKIM